MENRPKSATEECDGKFKAIPKIELKHGLQDIMDPKQIQFRSKKRAISDLRINFWGYKGEFVCELNKIISDDNQSSLDDFKIKLDEIQNLMYELQTNLFDQKQVLAIDKLNLKIAFINAKACLALAINQNTDIKDHKIFCAIKEALEYLRTTFLDPIPVG